MDEPDRSRTTDGYLDLYKTAVQEVHDYHALHHQRVIHFAGLVTTIVAGLFVAFSQATRWEHFAFVAVGLVMLIQVCRVGSAGISGAYRLLLEAISTRAKLEQALGLTESTWCDTAPNPHPSYWAGEGLVPTRHLADRCTFANASHEWEDHFLAESDQRWPIRFLSSVEILAIVLCLIAVVCALKQLINP